jgi:hypothetical protein
MPDVAALLPAIRRLHEMIRAAIVEECERASMDELSLIAEDAEGDTIYAIDRVSEDFEFFERELARTYPLVLIAEGLQGGQVVLPRVIENHQSCLTSGSLKAAVGAAFTSNHFGEAQSTQALADFMAYACVTHVERPSRA